MEPVSHLAREAGDYSLTRLPGVAPVVSSLALRSVIQRAGFSVL
jgi:hypothetical protein